MAFLYDTRIIFLNMAEKFYKNEKFQKVFYPALYVALTVLLVISGLVIFYNTYYTPIFVSGQSMMPTLLGGYTESGRVHYGISDNHRKKIDQLERFDVVITYYPASWNSGDEDTTYKIKRVWGFPGETISLTHTEDTYTFTISKGDSEPQVFTAPITKNKRYNLDGSEYSLTVATFTGRRRVFDVNLTSAYRTFDKVTLSEEKQEYFLMGDNWSGSHDSYYHIGSSEQINKGLLQGKVIAIQGTAIYDSATKKLKNKRKMRDLFYF